MSANPHLRELAVGASELGMQAFRFPSIRRRVEVLPALRAIEWRAFCAQFGWQHGAFRPMLFRTGGFFAFFGIIKKLTYIKEKNK